MSNSWCVAVAQHGKIDLAAEQANEQGVFVYVPRIFKREKVASNRAVVTCRPRIEPYFFISIDLTNEEEEALVRGLRGVDTLLCMFRSAGGRQRPKAIEASVIGEFRDREFAELRGATVRAKKSREDLELLAPHRIVRHANFAGQEGVLVAVSRGIAHLRVGGFLIALPDGDIAAIPKKAKAA